MKRYIILAILLACFSNMFAQKNFKGDNLVVYRIGDGTANYDPTQKVSIPIFLDEYQVTPTSASLVQSIALPTVSQGGNKRIVSAGQALTEGYISLSADGRYIVVPGYDADLKVNLGSVEADRVTALVDQNGNANTSTYSSDYPGGAFRSATSLDGTAVWVSGAGGDQGGVSYIPAGTNQTVYLNTLNKTTRQVKYYGGDLYVAGINYIHKVGTGAPTTPEEAAPFENITPDPGFSDCYNFYIVDLSVAQDGSKEVMYVEDAAYGLIKYAKVGGTWVECGDYGNEDTKSYRGLEGTVGADGKICLYIVQCTGTSSKLLSLIDNAGYNEGIQTEGPTTLIDFDGTHKAIRGIAWTPGTKGTSVESFRDNEVNIFVNNHCLYVRSSESNLIQVYNSVGILCYSMLVEGMQEIKELKKGELYIVKLGGKTLKVVL